MPYPNRIDVFINGKYDRVAFVFLLLSFPFPFCSLCCWKFWWKWKFSSREHQLMKCTHTQGTLWCRQLVENSTKHLKFTHTNTHSNDMHAKYSDEFLKQLQIQFGCRSVMKDNRTCKYDTCNAIYLLFASADSHLVSFQFSSHCIASHWARCNSEIDAYSKRINPASSNFKMHPI